MHTEPVRIMCMGETDNVTGICYDINMLLNVDIWMHIVACEITSDEIRA